jgi:hypothetical protein
MRITTAAMIAYLALPMPLQAQQFTDAMFCQAMQEIATQGNKDAGTKVDAVTTHMGIAVLCNMKIVDFKKRLDISFRVMDAGWEGRKQAQWNQIYCTNPGFVQAIASGWTISSTMTDAEGKRHYMEAKCP